MNIVVTTIAPPTRGMIEISRRLETTPGTLWIVGDRKGPPAYALPAVRFLPIDEQLLLPFQLAKLLPEKHYTRKNLGYLAAIATGIDHLVETDDDNIPGEDFWCLRQASVDASLVRHPGWCNAYTFFTTARIWPRGLPLKAIRPSYEARPGLPSPTVCECLIQQGLANENPDVDAVYRLTGSLPIRFEQRAPVALARGTWCPFNSQNTTFFRAAFPLLYLPSCCTFRMTDIWRSFVAQRCLWEMNSTVLFSAATVSQDRNEHDLLRDFEDEIPGYLQNERIQTILEALPLTAGRAPSTVCQNLLACYEALVGAGIVGPGETPLVSAWCADLQGLLR